MGVKQSVQIETPKFIPSEWQPAQAAEIPEQYGVFRTLRHVKTGQKIDEYDLLWPSEEEYLYYLKSFNWRHRQANVVNTRFIQLTNHEEICSHSYMAKVYIQHVKVRISQISDIPFPDNLYVLMQALEGFSRIYEHSKYFEIEESQICVDQTGNVKVWINADLSINYPSSDRYSDLKDNGQQGMVDTIIAIVASNTDPETEPSPSFKEFYDQKKGKGKRFEEAKVMVLNYARINDTEIPGRFQAIMNMDNQEIDLKSFTDHNKSNQNIPKQQVHFEQEDRGSSDFYHYYNPPQQQQTYAQSQPIQNYSFGPRNPPQFLQGAPAAAHYVQQQVYPPQPAPYYSPPPPHPAAPVYYIPHYARIEYPVRPFNPNAPQQLYPMQPAQNMPFPPQTLPEAVNIEAVPLQSRKSDTAGQYAQQSGINRDTSPQTNEQLALLEDEHQEGEYLMDDDEHLEEAQFIEPVTTNPRNTGSFRDQTNSISQADDLVARSLPIKAGYPSQNTQQLSAMGQGDRAIYSHINQKDQRGNVDGFGLTKNSQLKLKDSAMSSQRGALTASKPKPKANPIKYFYSLEEELEIDPDIAADMAKYLS